MEHPLKVFYQYGGEHYILHYHTHNEQHQIILAESIKKIDEIFGHILNDVKKIKEITIIDFFKVNIVAPSSKLCIEAQNLKNKKDIEDFFIEVVDCFVQAHESSSFNKEKEYPCIFKICNNFEIKNNSDEEIHEYNCKNCWRRLSLNNISKEDFYKKYNEKWIEIFPNHVYQSKLMYSKASIAKDNDELYIAYLTYSDGIGFIEALPDEIIDLYNSVLFYYINEQKINYSKYTDALNDRKLFVKKQEKEKNDLLIKNRQISEDKFYNELLNVFKD